MSERIHTTLQFIWKGKTSYGMTLLKKWKELQSRNMLLIQKTKRKKIKFWYEKIIKEYYLDLVYPVMPIKCSHIFHMF